MGFSKLKHVFMNEAGAAGAAGAGGAGAAGAAGAAAAAAAVAGAGAVPVADARKFVTDFVHDPKAVETMKDEDVLAYHGRINATLDKVRPKANGAWPEKWREEFAGGDEKLMQRFGRYNTPKDVAAALVAAQTRLSSGELKTALPKDATPEQVTAWRKENGIPEKPEEYFAQIKLKDGLVIGDEDKPIVEAFAKAAHAAHFNPTQVAATLDWYYGELDRQTQEQAAKDADAAQKVSDTLHQQWGPEFRLNMNIFNSFMDSAPAKLKEALMRGRLADGTPVGSSAEMINWITLKAKELNPAGIIVPAGGGSMAASIDDELKTIQGWMSAPEGSPEHAKYWKDSKISGPDGRYQQLLRAQERAKAAG
jgi:hypothetical protein